MNWFAVRRDIEAALQDPRVALAIRVADKLQACAAQLLDVGSARPRVRAVAIVTFCSVFVFVMASSTDAAPPPLPVAPGGAFIDFVIRNQNSTFMRWMSTGKMYAFSLFGPLLACQLVLVGKKASQEGFFAGMYGLVDVVMRKGIWAYFLMNVETLATGIPDGIAHVGAVVAGSNVEGQPSSLVDLGKVAWVNLAEASFKGGLLDVGVTGIIAFCVGGLVFGMFALAGWVLALTIMYVKVVAVGGLLLVGLSGADFTAKYAWRYVEFLVRGGLKQLGVALVLGLVASSAQQWKLQAESASMPGVEAHMIALDMLASSFGLLFLMLMIPQVTSSMASGGLGDVGESKIGGALAAVSQAAAMGAVAKMLGGAMPSASAGAVSSAGAGQTPEQRAELLVQAASSGLGSTSAGGSGSGGSGAADSAAKKPSSTMVGPAPDGGSDGDVQDAASKAGRAAGSVARSMRGGVPEEGDDE